MIFQGTLPVLLRNLIALQLLFISEEDAKIWRLKHPYSWTIDDITSWGNYVAETNNFSQSLHRALVINLRRFSGKQLMHMTYDDVRRRFSDVGDILYSAMQQLFSGYTEYQGIHEQMFYTLEM